VKDPHSAGCRGYPPCPTPCFGVDSALSKFLTLVWAEMRRRLLDLEGETGIAPGLSLGLEIPMRAVSCGRCSNALPGHAARSGEVVGLGGSLGL